MKRWIPLIALGLAACAPEYVYRPTEQVTATSAGRPASRYDIPPESPRGSVTASTFGIANFIIGREGERVRLLHVRLVISNDNDNRSWLVDTRRQIVALPNEGESRPAYVNSNIQGLPYVNIPPGQKRTLDLYYALPPSLQRARNIPEFDVLWSVQTAARVVAVRTPFEREEIEPAYYSDFDWGWGWGGPYGLGWGSAWWYDPLYPSATFYHPLLLRQEYPLELAPPPGGRQVYVARPPR